MIFFEGHPSISPSFSLETWTVLETYLPSSTEIANIMQREHSYQRVRKENAFGSITLKLGAKERWIFACRK